MCVNRYHGWCHHAQSRQFRDPAAMLAHDWRQLLGDIHRDSATTAQRPRDLGLQLFMFEQSPCSLSCFWPARMQCAGSREAVQRHNTCQFEDSSHSVLPLICFLTCTMHWYKHETAYERVLGGFLFGVQGFATVRLLCVPKLAMALKNKHWRH